MPRRFDTRFFAAELPDGAEASFEIDEVIAHRWLTASDALDAMADGVIAMWVPTSATLQQLDARLRSRGDPRADRARVRSPRRASSRSGRGSTRVVVSGAGAVPGQTVNAYLVGRRRLVLVDPGRSIRRRRRTRSSVPPRRSGGAIVAIALTHVDPDHAAGAEGIALRLERADPASGPGGGRPPPVHGPRARRGRAHHRRRHRSWR